ncbi:deaminase domain-containing protein [Mesobacillus zeae]|nr:deaminase domain-containing protein [Mesobacillus zeae]
MGKLTIHTDDISSHIRTSYARYTEQEEIIRNHINILQNIRSSIGVEDLSAVEYELSQLEDKGRQFTDNIMPQLHNMPITTKPMGPYNEAVSEIQRFAAANDIPTFIKEIRRISPFSASIEVPEEVKSAHGFFENNAFGKSLAGVGTGLKDVVVDTWEGLISLTDADTWEAMGQALVNIDETVPLMWEQFTTSFEDQVINGDAKSRAHWFSYSAGNILIGVLGTKGLDKASKLAGASKLANNIKTAVPDTINRIKNFPLNALAREQIQKVQQSMNNLFWPADNLAIAGGGYIPNKMVDDVPDVRKAESVGGNGGGRVVEDVDKGTGKVYPTRQIDSVAEAHIIDRVKELRGNLLSKYKKAGNFALAEVDVSGISKSEFYAQSRINNLKGSLEDKVPDISLQPENPMFKATKAVGKDGESYLRDTDTEYKILNDIASRLGENTQATGTIKLFTELDTCDSCSRVIADFAAKYKNIKLEIIHNDGNRIIP